MRISPSALALIAASSLAIVGGCKTGEPATDDVAEVALSPESDPILASAPNAEPLQDSSDSDLRAQKIDTLVKGYLSNADAAMSNGDFAEAKKQLQSAYELDPSDPEIQRRLDYVAVQLGEREATFGEMRDAASARYAVRRQQATLEVRNAVGDARRLQESGDVDGAIRSLEKASLILQWNPDLDGSIDDAGHTATEIRARIAELRADRARQERELLAEQQRRADLERREKEDQERERSANLIATFLEKANASFYRQDYGEAETFCDQVLDLDPNHIAAAELKSVANEARHAQLQDGYRAEFKRHWRRIFDEIALMNAPVVDLVSFPDADVWRRITERGPVSFQLEEEVVTPEDQRVIEALDTQPIEISFEDVGLEEAIEWFRISTNVNFIIDPVVYDVGGADEAFNLKLGQRAAGSALKVLLSVSTVPMGFLVKDGVVRIISTEEATGGQTLQIYDVRDLTNTISSFPSRDYHLTPSGAFEEFEDDEDDPVPLVMDADALTELIRGNIAVESWDNDPNNQINLTEAGALVVHQTPDVHAQIDKLLRDLRSNAGTLVNVESRFLNLQDRFLSDIGIDFRGLDGQNASLDSATVPNEPLDDFGQPPGVGVGSPSSPRGIGSDNDAGAVFTEGGDVDVRGRLENLYDLSLGDSEFQGSGGLSLEYTYIDDTTLEAILRAVEKSTTAELIQAPNLTVFNGQRAHISLLEHRTYVRDFEVEIAQGAVIADPQLGVLQIGPTLDVRPVVSADRRFVTLEVRPTLIGLVEPIRVFRTSLGIGNDVEIEMPEQEIQRVRTTVTVPDGSTLMLGGLKKLVDRNYESTLPFLGDLPIISFLFSRRGNEDSKEKIMILVKPTIIIPEELEERSVSNP